MVGTDHFVLTLAATLSLTDVKVINWAIDPRWEGVYAGGIMATERGSYLESTG